MNRRPVHRGKSRGDGNRFIATPTATSKRLVTERTLIEVDAKGQVHGSGKVFGEIGLHLVVYERRRDVSCVVHAHPPNATAIASVSAPNPIDRPFIALTYALEADGVKPEDMFPMDLDRAKAWFLSAWRTAAK